MSSTISHSEMKTLSQLPKEEQPPTVVLPCAPPPPPLKPHLIRSSSVEKIIKFNAYICSQNYYILPSLLVWLRTSQTALTNHAERTIQMFKSLFVATALFRMLERRFGIVWPSSSKSWLQVYGACSSSLKHGLITSAKYLHSNSDLISVYAALAIIAIQLVSCLLLLSSVFVPAGFVFMITCMCIMGHIGARTMFHHMKQERLKEGGTGAGCAQTSRNSRDTTRKSCKIVKPVLGDRTISNVNLF